MSSEITPVSCDTELTVIRNEHSEISASATSDTLPENECDHYGVDSGGTDYYGTSNPPQECDWNYSFCPMCGEQLEEDD